MITCFFEGGHKALLRHVTVGTILVKDGKILLAKRGTFRGKPMLEMGKWCPLGGYMERDETLIECAKREIMEESGWEADNFVLLRINDNPKRPHEDRQNVDVIFFADAIKQVGGHDEEVQELRWFPVDALPSAGHIAFDHADNLALYVKYTKEKFALPVLG